MRRRIALGFSKVLGSLGIIFFVAIAVVILIGLGGALLRSDDGASSGNSMSQSKSLYREVVSSLPGVRDYGSQDVDCATVGEAVSVTGGDRYRLDEDDDGIGCDEYLEDELRSAAEALEPSYPYP